MRWRTPLILLLQFLLPTVLPAAGRPVPEETPWYRRHLVGLEVGPTGSQFGGSAADSGYAARFDGREIARRTRACGGEYLVIWARDGDWAYYDSKLQSKAPGLGERDVLREAAEEGRRLGLPIIAYCQQQYPGHTLREHPDWRAVAPDGKPIDGRVCYRSGYREFMKSMLSEQLAYGIAGFHLDMVDQGFGAPYGCWCTPCREAFRAQFGREMPKGVTWDEDWDRMLEFRYASSDLFEKEMTAHVRSVDPGATVDFNYHGSPPFSWEVGQLPVRHAMNGDFVTGETGVWGFSALTVGLNAAFYRAATPGKPFQVAIQRGVRMYHDQTTRPLNDIRWELMTLLSHGAFVTMVDKTGFDGWLDPVAYARFGQAFGEVHEKRSHFGQEPVIDVGIYYSARTRDWVGRDQPARVFQHLQGAHKTMVYEHVPWGILHSENLAEGGLGRHPVVCLPNVSILSPDEVALLRGYVEGGGCLLVTGLTGTHDRMGRLQDRSDIEALVGARFVRGVDSTDNWVRFDEPLRPGESSFQLDPGAAGEGLPLGWPFLVRGPAAVWEPVTATTAGTLMRPHRTALHAENRYNPDWPLSADSPVGPAVLFHQVGKGRVLTLAASPDWAAASDHHIVEARRLLAGAVRWLHPEPRVRITAPATVEAVVTDDAASRTLRVHLLGYNAPPQTTPAKDRPYALPVPIEDRPMYRVTVSVDQRIRRVRTLNPGTEVRRRGRTIEATVEDIHEALVIRY